MGLFNKKPPPNLRELTREELKFLKLDPSTKDLYWQERKIRYEAFSWTTHGTLITALIGIIVSLITTIVTAGILFFANIDKIRENVKKEVQDSMAIKEIKNQAPQVTVNESASPSPTTQKPIPESP